MPSSKQVHYVESQSCPGTGRPANHAPTCWELNIIALVRAFLSALEAQPLKACSLIFQVIVSHYSCFLGCTYLIVQANKLVSPKLRGLLIKYNSCCGPAFVNVLAFQTLIKYLYIYIYIFTGFDRCPKWGNNIIQSHPKSWRHQGFWGTSIPDIIPWATAAARAEQKARVAWPKPRAPRAPRAWVEEPIANGWASINKNITGLGYKWLNSMVYGRYNELVNGV